MKNKKKKGFYNNKDRDQRWTEEPVGRPIAFADKYEHPEANDSLNNESVKRRTSQIKEEKKKKRLNRFICIIACIALICVGYTGMQVHINRHTTPLNNHNRYQAAEDGNMSGVNLEIQSLKVESIGLDGSVMLSSVISEVEELGFTSVTFDAKRSDGSIGYTSNLASVDTFNAVSAPATDLKGSVDRLLENDILPVARICCYRDNVVPSVTTDATIMTETGVYTDEDGNTYLNPNSTTTYNYLKDIITECYDSGITVFVLYGCDLPEEISDSYNDGFQALASKLNVDLENNVRLYEAVDIEINKSNQEDYQSAEEVSDYDNENEESTSSADSYLAEIEKPSVNQVYYIKSEIDRNETITALADSGITSYILED